MPPQVLLAAKLMAVFFLVRYLDSDGRFWGMRLGSPSLEVGLALTFLRWLAKGLAPIAAALLLFNHGARALCVIFGASVAYEFLLHRIGHADLFLAVFLILAAFETDGVVPRRPRYLIVLTYLAGGIAWILAYIQPDAIPDPAPFVLPPKVIPEAANWAMALIPLLLAAAFSVPRFRPPAIWAGIVFHCVFRDVEGPFGGAFIILAAYLVFADWPRERLTVLYDGDCGFCNKTREWISKFDLERLYDWKPYQTGAGEAFGISTEALERRAHVVSPRGIDSGFQAFRVMALYNPLTYFAVAAVVIAIRGASLTAQNVVLGLMILGFSPLVRPLGEVVYDWVARNRHRLPPRSCKAPE